MAFLAARSGGNADQERSRIGKSRIVTGFVFRPDQVIDRHGGHGESRDG